MVDLMVAFDTIDNTYPPLNLFRSLVTVPKWLGLCLSNRCQASKIRFYTIRINIIFGILRVLYFFHCYVHFILLHKTNHKPSHWYKVSLPRDFPRLPQTNMGDFYLNFGQNLKFLGVYIDIGNNSLMRQVFVLGYLRWP